MRAKFNLITVVALVSSSWLYGNQIYFSQQDNKNRNRTSVDVGTAKEGSQNQNTNQGASPGKPGGGGTSPGGGSGPRRRAAAKIAKDASTVFDEIMSVPDRSIPVDLLAQAAAIAIFLGEGRQGVISLRTDSGWGAPVFYNLSGEGLKKSDYVLLIMNRDSLSGLLTDKIEMGKGMAAGPVGRYVGASTDPGIRAGILFYSHIKDALSGSTVKRVSVSPANDLNEAIYQLKANQLFVYAGFRGKLPEEVRIIPDTLSRHSRR